MKTSKFKKGYKERVNVYSVLSAVACGIFAVSIGSMFFGVIALMALAICLFNN